MLETENALASESYLIVDFHSLPVTPSTFTGLFSSVDESSSFVNFPSHFHFNIPFILNVIIPSTFLYVVNLKYTNEVAIK
jgi:hypothetical protein